MASRLAFEIMQCQLAFSLHYKIKEAITLPVFSPLKELCLLSIFLILSGCKSIGTKQF